MARFFHRNIIWDVSQKPEECLAIRCRREIVTLAIALPVAFKSMQYQSEFLVQILYCKLTVARLVNSFGPMHFSVFIHLDMESCPAVEEGIGIVVLMPEDVMRYPLHWEVLRDGPGDDDHVKMRSRRLDYVVEVGTIEQSGDTVAPKVENPGSERGRPLRCGTHFDL
ncbi:hypothetical protein [uncultured Marinobacter sp.]|uniref:hypothetical protein n=1 Tax=uncultured Marinobacter sp. TaxID=187379 RepID=UPI0025988A37|nr:hypothetical protein [uncultured Marinobacter sp.]